MGQSRAQDVLTEQKTLVTVQGMVVLWDQNGKGNLLWEGLKGRMD